MARSLKTKSLKNALKSGNSECTLINIKPVFVSGFVLRLNSQSEPLYHRPPSLSTSVWPSAVLLQEFESLVELREGMSFHHWVQGEREGPDERPS